MPTIIDGTNGVDKIASGAIEYADLPSGSAPMSDYLDGVVKGDQQQIDAHIAKCLEVKAKYPK